VQLGRQVAVLLLRQVVIALHVGKLLLHHGRRLDSRLIDVDLSLRLTGRPLQLAHAQPRHLALRHDLPIDGIRLQLREPFGRRLIASRRLIAPRRRELVL
jgi:hypothetical protein